MFSLCFLYCMPHKLKSPQRVTERRGLLANKGLCAGRYSGAKAYAKIQKILNQMLYLYRLNLALNLLKGRQLFDTYRKHKQIYSNYY